MLWRSCTLILQGDGMLKHSLRRTVDRINRFSKNSWELSFQTRKFLFSKIRKVTVGSFFITITAMCIAVGEVKLLCSVIKNLIKHDNTTRQIMTTFACSNKLFQRNNFRGFADIVTNISICDRNNGTITITELVFKVRKTSISILFAKRTPKSPCSTLNTLGSARIHIITSRSYPVFTNNTWLVPGYISLTHRSVFPGASLSVGESFRN